MKNLQSFRQLIRRLSTSMPNSMRISLRLLESSKNAIGENISTTISSSSSKIIPKSIRAQRKLSFGEQSEILRRKRPMVSIGGLALLTIPVTTFVLGVWQIDRRRQKMEKIKGMEQHMKKEPIDLPQDLRELSNLEYHPVRVVGEFLHDEEIVVKPRHRHDTYRLGGVETTAFERMNEVGAQIITPFKLADRHYKILIQRGWVPLANVDASTRQGGQVKGQVEIVGLVRGNEKKPKFVPENDPLEGDWHYRDVDMMARMRNSAPIYLEAVSSATVHEGPIGGQTILVVRNEHLSYIITWFSLSALTGWLWFRRYVRPIPK